TARKHWTSCSARIAVRRSAQSRVERSRVARRSLASMRSGASAHVRITLGAPQRTSSVAHNAAADQSAWAREKEDAYGRNARSFSNRLGCFRLAIRGRMNETHFERHNGLRDVEPVYVRFGSRADTTGLLSNVRFTPQSGQSADMLERTFALQHLYSIT